MNLDKFLDLLIGKHLFFTNISNFTDRNEGFLPKKTIQAKKRLLKKEGLIGRDLAEEIAKFEYEYNSLRNLTLVNSWSSGTTESYALWKIYLQGSKSGVAIQSTIASLLKAIDDGGESYAEEIWMGGVKYKNYLSDNDLKSRLNLVTWKNKFYAFEKEIRLCIFHNFPSEGGDNPPYRIKDGRYYLVDLNGMIRNIYISPFMGSWFESTLESIVKKYAPFLSTRLIRSEVKDI